MDFLKGVITDELLAQLEEALKDSKIKLADIGGGQYVQREKLTTIEAERDNLKKQLEEAGKRIASFESMDIESIKKSSEEYKKQLEQTTAESQQQIRQMRMEHALDQALREAKAKNPVTVQPLLIMSKIQYSEDGGFSGLKEQLDSIREQHAYLFESETPEQRSGGSSITKGKPPAPDGDTSGKSKTNDIMNNLLRGKTTQ